MKLFKRIKISEIIKAENPPTRITQKLYGATEKNIIYFLDFDKKSCEFFNLPTSFELTNILDVSLESQEFKESLEENQVKIILLEKKEVVGFSQGFFGVNRKGDKPTVKISFLLKISSETNMDPHFESIPCPFFSLVFELTEDEYEECKKLPFNSCFKISFSVLMK